jgi:hypothetical protein
LRAALDLRGSTTVPLGTSVAHPFLRADALISRIHATAGAIIEEWQIAI